jgi:uncharacterized protein (TIGR02391 family)
MVNVSMPGSRSTPPIQRKSANLSPAQMHGAIPLLEARIAELEALSVETVSSRSDPKVSALQSAIDGTLDRIFGADTNEYHRLSAAKVLDAPLSVVAAASDPTPILQIRQRIEENRQRAIALLSQEVALMKEQLGDSVSGPAERAIRAYGNLDLHPEVARAASELYRDGHYANAIEDAVKALNDLVRMRSGEALDGTKLMQKVFSSTAPILRFNPLADQSDKDEQVGFMMMFSGAVAGLRNPRAHKLIKDDPERALEFIAFVSLLAKLLDTAKKAPPP